MHNNTRGVACIPQKLKVFEVSTFSALLVSVKVTDNEEVASCPGAVAKTQRY